MVRLIHVHLPKRYDIGLLVLKKTIIACLLSIKYLCCHRIKPAFSSVTEDLRFIPRPGKRGRKFSRSSSWAPPGAVPLSLGRSQA